MKVHKKKETTNRVMWIDVAKFLAIVAVMIDHTSGTLYSSHYVMFFSYYSVSLFIFVLGITTIWEYTSKNIDNTLGWVKLKCLKIVRPYIVANIICGVCIYRRFDFEIILNGLIHFNLIGPFYYVLLYIQLILISPLLFEIFNRADNCTGFITIEIIGLLFMVFISILTTNYSSILGVYGGGGKLFGGTYLILFYLGMWFGKHYNKIYNSISSKLAIFFVIITCISTFIWWLFISDNAGQIDSIVPFGEGFNPPSVSLCVYSLLVAAMLFFSEIVLRSYSFVIITKATNIMANIGRHTLYIFLYHLVLAGIVIPGVHQLTGITIYNIWVKRIVYFGMMIIGSVILEIVLEKTHSCIMKALNTCSLRVDSK